jgi:hypothetical protein
MNDDFFAFSAGPALATILFIVLPILALVMARLFVKKL